MSMRALQDAVAEWREMQADRDRLRDETLIPLVRELVAAGVSQREIYRVTGINQITLGRWTRA
jgi:DNA invertase Pin-like site-specific DNA recombinase